VALVDVELLALAEPLRVAEEDRDRNRVELLGSHSAILEECLERVLAASVEMPVGA
jgi:hypothetical protein